MWDTKSAFPVTTDRISYDDMKLHGGSRQIDYVAHDSTASHDAEPQRAVCGFDLPSK
jgi:hypothetical protein